MLKNVDHITYACTAGSIERWAWFHIEVEGGTLINRIDDVRPDDVDSSMKIWCIDFGGFGGCTHRGDRSRQAVAGDDICRTSRRPLGAARCVRH